MCWLRVRTKEEERPKSHLAMPSPKYFLIALLLIILSARQIIGSDDVELEDDSKDSLAQLAARAAKLSAAQHSTSTTKRPQKRHSTVSTTKSPHHNKTAKKSHLSSHFGDDEFNAKGQRLKRQDEGGLEDESKALVCDFGAGGQLDYCNWYVPAESHPNVRWRTGQGSMAYWLGGPLIDKTNDDNSGEWLYGSSSSRPSVYGERRLCSRRRKFSMKDASQNGLETASPGSAYPFALAALDLSPEQF